MSDERRTVDVVGLLVELGIEFRDRGDEYWAVCPHPDHPKENTPSWSIGEHGGHYCFGCKEKGGPLDLVMWLIDLSDYRACSQWIEDNGLYGDGKMPLAVELKVVRPDEDDQMEMPADVRMKPLKEWVTPARRYMKKRGVSRAQVERWGLGYATGGYYSNRIILPTRDRSGRLLNITGRAWSASKLPKYLNSKEIHGWDPSAVFGEQFWPLYVTRSTLILCEGELNALAVERRGYECVGALGGSQLEKEQILKFSQFQRIILAVDIDKAGSNIAAALKASLHRWGRVSRVDFPDGRDPNDLEREQPELLDLLLEDAS